MKNISKFIKTQRTAAAEETPPYITHPHFHFCNDVNLARLRAGMHRRNRKERKYETVFAWRIYNVHMCRAQTHSRSKFEFEILHDAVQCVSLTVVRAREALTDQAMEENVEEFSGRGWQIRRKCGNTSLGNTIYSSHRTTRSRGFYRCTTPLITEGQRVLEIGFTEYNRGKIYEITRWKFRSRNTTLSNIDIYIYV